MALHANADVRRLLSRIRPNAEWGWRGGDQNDHTLIRWRDGVQVEPTEAEYLAEQAIVDTEDLSADTARLSLIAAVDALQGTNFDTASLLDMRPLLQILFLERGALDINGTFLPVSEWKISLRKPWA